MLSIRIIAVGIKSTTHTTNTHHHQHHHQHHNQQHNQNQHHHQNDHRIVYGMVGFPNVGKSSVINVLMGNTKYNHKAVRVAVANRPGKTKHSQTLLLPNYPITLCDCPGLVFPSFVSNTADLLVAGVYPISHMRDYYPVIQLICQRFPRRILEAYYSIVLPLPHYHAPSSSSSSSQ
jgi:ribosome biogenesis GTPase A